MGVMGAGAADQPSRVRTRLVSLAPTVIRISRFQFYPANYLHGQFFLAC